MLIWNARRSVRVVLGVIAATAATAVVAGCGNDDKKSSAKPASFVIQATSAGKKKPKLSIPPSVPAGLVAISLKNTDTSPRSAGIIRIVGDHSVAEVLKVTGGDGAPIPDWLQDGGGLGAVAPGKTATATQNLAPGKYVVTDDEGGDGDGPTNAELGATGEFTVTGKAKDAELPSVPATITATDKGETGYKFSTDGLKAGTNQVRFENTGKQLHHALLFPLNPGATLADVKKFASSQGDSGGPPPFDFTKGASANVIDGGIAQNIELDLQAGKYALLCFIQDRDGGKPHVTKGMLAEVDIK